MRIKSNAFVNGGVIPRKYTCQGDDISPPLTIEDIPEKAQFLALIADDPDAPSGTWTHWVLFNVPPAENITEDGVPGKQGMNDFGNKDYGGPCPPSGTHRYFFRLFALDTAIELDGEVRRDELEGAMQGHVLAEAELMGKYSRE